MDFGFVCLVLQNISLSPSMRLQLVNITKQLAKTGKNLIKIKEKDIEGNLRTKWETVMVGSFVGIRFHAEVETEYGSGKVVFLMDEEELRSDLVYDEENSFWANLSSDPVTAAKKAALN